jgi:hypothetical protein
MAQPVCPSCRADLDDDLVASTGAAKCPFCGADLSGIDFAPVETLPEVPFEDALTAETAISAVADDTEFDAPLNERRPGARLSTGAAPSALRAELPLPAKSRIEVVESTADRRVIAVPAGGHGTAAIGFFAIVWNGFMLVFTTIIAFAGNQGPNAPPWYFLVPFLGLFWAVGLGFVYAWVRMKFTRTLLLLEQDRLVIQRILFGRKKMTETLVGPETRAALEVAYEQNDKPVHCVAVNGTNRTEKFATSLSPEEKDWFVDSINGFLGAAGVPAACAAVLDKAGGEVVAPLSPGELPASSMITVDDATHDHLRFHLPFLPPGGTRVLVSAIGLVFSAIWLCLNFFAGNGVDGIGDALFAALGLFPLTLSVMAVRGKIAVDLTKERLQVRWHCGRFGLNKELPAPSVHRVALIANVADKHGRKAPRPASTKTLRVCTVFAGKDSVALTTVHDAEIARQAGGLVRSQLEQMGFQVEDV